MWAENAFYGHRAALAAYAGVAERAIPGRLQHGWQPGPGHPLATFRQSGLHLVWSQRNVDAAAAAGLRGAVAVGAPWLYAGPLRDGAPDVEAGQGEGVLAMPFHGWERGKVAGDFDRYADALIELRDRGFGPITVCMYWAEYDDPALRAVFSARGFEVVTAGRRDDNPAFLATLRGLIARHRLVTSNRVATATFYALASGRAFVLHGPCMGLAGGDDPDGSSYDAWQRAAFPALTLDAFDGTVHRDIGLRELGADHLRSPSDLRDLLLWQPGQRLAHTAALALRQLERVRPAFLR